MTHRIFFFLCSSFHFSPTCFLALASTERLAHTAVSSVHVLPNPDLYPRACCCLSLPISQDPHGFLNSDPTLFFLTFHLSKQFSPESGRFFSLSTYSLILFFFFKSILTLRWLTHPLSTPQPPSIHAAIGLSTLRILNIDSFICV